MRKTAKSHKTMQVRAAVLSHYEDVARKLGVNPLPLLNKVGLSRRMLTVPTQLIPIYSAVALLELTAQTSKCDTVGLMMAEARVLADFGPISLLLLQQPNVRSALNTIAQYRHVLNESLAMYIENAGKLTLIREEIVIDHPSGIDQSTDMAIGLLPLIFRAILGSHWRPQSVHFTHAESQNTQIHKRIFKCPLHFNSDFNGLICLTSDMDQINTQADATMASYAQSFLDAIPKSGQSSTELDVRRAVYLMLPMGRANISQVASGMGMNVRFLQRRLDESGISFSTILNDVRYELAQRYIANTTYSLGRIAELLGYSNLSSFTRWFIAQFQCAPSQMRN